MPVGLLFLGLLATSGAFRPSRRGEFAPNPGSSDPNLIGGDIMLDTISGSGPTQNAFVKNKENLWPQGRVPYRTELQKRIVLRVLRGVQTGHFNCALTALD